MSIQHDRKYFVQDQTTRGREILLQANLEGDKKAKYGLAIALLYESNNEGIQLLLSILNQLDGKQLLQNYRQILQYTTFGTNTFHIPINQACKILKWIVGIVNVLTLMEIKNYM